MTADPCKASGGPADPGSWNRYGYTRGDPVNRYDPSGRDDCDPEGDCYFDEPSVPVCPGGRYFSPIHGECLLIPSEMAQRIQDCINAKNTILNAQADAHWTQLNKDNGKQILTDLAKASIYGLMTGTVAGWGLTVLAVMASDPWKMLIAHLIAFEWYVQTVITPAKEKAVTDCTKQYEGP